MMKEYLTLHTIALAAGIILDFIIGDPHSLPHPVRAIGSLISMLEGRLYKEKADRKLQFFAGALLWMIVVTVTGAVTGFIMFLSYRISPYLYAVIETILTFYILAAGSLRDESMKVYKELEKGNIEGARYCLSMIVGRDTEKLGEAAVTRAAVETVAENTSDGVIAPLLYTAALGPAGGMVYKAVNTMDSMMGYRNDKYEYFGKFAARADDIANLIPSRISALFMIISSFFLGMFLSVYSGIRALKIWWRDRYGHKSPNSAQTESACAGALGIRLGGSSTYGGKTVDKPFIGDDIRAIAAEDIKRSIKIMFFTEALCTAAIFILIMLILISL